MWEIRQYVLDRHSDFSASFLVMCTVKKGNLIGSEIIIEIFTV